MDLKKSNLVRSGGAGRVKESVSEKESLILLNFSEKKSHKLVGKTKKYCF